jgi:hypothetical protein
MVLFAAMTLETVSLQQQRERQPDPAAVAGDVQSIQNSVREIDARLQQAMRRDALKSESADARSARAELESVSKSLKTLDQRLSKVLAHDALKKPGAGANQAGRTLDPVLDEMKAISAELSSTLTRVNKIDSFTIKVKTADSQQLQSDLEFIRKSAERARQVYEGGLSGSTRRLPVASGK